MYRQTGHQTRRNFNITNAVTYHLSSAKAGWFRCVSANDVDIFSDCDDSRLFECDAVQFGRHVQTFLREPLHSFPPAIHLAHGTQADSSEGLSHVYQTILQQQAG
jgi:hypothetical protein